MKLLQFAVALMAATLAVLIRAFVPQQVGVAPMATQHALGRLMVSNSYLFWFSVKRKKIVCAISETQTCCGAGVCVRGYT
jgi:hypothetical protein